MSVQQIYKFDDDEDYDEEYRDWINKQKETLERHNIDFVHEVEDGVLLRTWHKSEIPNGVLVEITTPSGGIEHSTPYYRTDFVLPSIRWWIDQGNEISKDYDTSSKYDYSELGSDTLLSRII